MVAVSCFVVLQLLSACYDLATLRIPNVITGAIVLLFFIVAVPNFGHIDWMSHLGAGALVFLFGAVLFRFRIIGGGDVKLMSANALWAGFHMLVPMLVVMGILGALLVVVLKVFAPRVIFLLSMTLPFDFRVLPQALVGRNIPYGVAIAGSALVLLQQFSPVLFSH